ncbi:MAG TPA: bifunctional hydroxymethylpyrimidine kinase/phosphomethylpyrimidine kinase [Pyrinomonadaceae bacterium]|jgi:hydroxymethylpyrimidine kinase/phosphomethylpyrimidine kinase|nr:bifunctional hydroxymethylpyrimidine kinase/phosphomethylpyrimidine kinase [Pyrinomonadaceae bacterium]
MSDDESVPPVALTVAGFDPSGGAGVVADIKTFTAFGCFATAAVTSLTFQNTMGVFGAAHQSAEAVRAQVLPVVEDFTVACAKTGMLPTREVIEEVARLFREEALPAPVVDPVVRSTSGYDLIDDEALASLVKELIPLARVLTPNIPEAERMTGLKITDEEGMLAAARRLRELGARAVVVKGGHLSGEALDILDDDGRVTVFRAERIETTSTHGTGCTLAAAIAACLGRGMSLEEAVGTAKRFVTDAIKSAPRIGHGHGPINNSGKWRVTSDE